MNADADQALNATNSFSIARTLREIKADVALLTEDTFSVNYPGKGQVIEAEAPQPGEYKN